MTTRMLYTPRLPLATYRLQFNPDFTFQDALTLVDYLHALGITDVYTSPLFQPRSGSNHGYDVVDPNRLNAMLGTPEDFDHFTEALQERDMGLLLDIVPNHMGVNTENDWWMDVLKHGPSSVYGHYFDVNWRPLNRALDDKVLLPVLGDHYGRVLEAGDLELVYWHGDFYMHYYEHQFPLTPETYADILQRVHRELIERPFEDHVERELLSLITAIEHLPPYTATYDAALTVRRREQIVIRDRLLALFDNNASFRQALGQALETLNGNPDEPASFDDLDELLSRQPYRLAYWRVATDEINYRRFFTINDMAAVRVEDPEVFADMHRLTFQLLAENKVTGLRIDHPDGLWDPQTYFEQLQRDYMLARAAHLQEDVEQEMVSEWLATRARSDEEPSRWPLYVVVEKILSETEPLPYSWAVYGTTGYDFLNAVNQLFVNPENEAAFDDIYHAFSRETRPFHEVTDDTKKLIMSKSLTSEIDARSAELARIVEHNRRYRGFTQNSLAFGMSEIIAALPVYRTYITGPDDVTERDRRFIEDAVALAKRRNPLTPGSVFDFLRETLLMSNFDNFEPRQREALRAFVMKFQQITGPVMAKSVEDTAFYIYNRLVSLNEVGSHPNQFGRTVDDFHRHNREKGYPYTMLATSTHDTKRGEDVRARVNVLSEMPETWQQAIEQWAEINASAKSTVEGKPAPSPNDEYLLYQTLLGAFPDAPNALDSFKKRVIQYMHKAINEAKVHSNWVNPNHAYAEAIGDFVSTILDDEDFRATFDPLQQRVAFYGRLNSLSQTLLKLTSPGIPDIYQGNEMWRYSLVDPDNRRPVDFGQRREILEDLSARAAKDRRQLAQELIKDISNGAIKLYLIYRILNYRREHRDLFLKGTYHHLSAQGAKAKHVCAFSRQHGDQMVLVIVPRLIVGLTGGAPRVPVGSEVWQDTYVQLPDMHDFKNMLTGEETAAHVREGLAALSLADAFSIFPVGVFEAKRTQSTLKIT